MPVYKCSTEWYSHGLLPKGVTFQVVCLSGEMPSPQKIHDAILSQLGIDQPLNCCYLSGYKVEIKY